MSTESYVSSLDFAPLLPPGLDTERSPSPSLSTRAIHTSSRPNSYNELKTPFNFASLRVAEVAGVQTSGKMTACADTAQSDAQSILSRTSRRSNGTTATFRSRLARRSDRAQNLPVLQDDEESERQVATTLKEKKTWTGSRKLRRTMSRIFPSMKENTSRDLSTCSLKDSKADFPARGPATPAVTVGVSHNVDDETVEEEEIIDGLDDVTREAIAVSRSVGAEWAYVEEE